MPSKRMTNEGTSHTAARHGKMIVAIWAFPSNIRISLSVGKAVSFYKPKYKTNWENKQFECSRKNNAQN